MLGYTGQTSGPESVRVRVGENELRAWGKRIGSSVEPPLFLALVGPLGAGKSVLARSIGEGVGVHETMPSPSYNLMFRYATAQDVDVVHLDLYRLESVDELWELGWGTLGQAHEVVIVEWPERAEGAMPPDHWVIDISLAEDDPSLRDIAVRRVGSPPELPSFPMAIS